MRGGTDRERFQTGNVLLEVSNVQLILCLDGRQERFVRLEIFYQILKHLSVSLSCDITVRSHDPPHGNMAGYT